MSVTTMATHESDAGQPITLLLVVLLHGLALWALMRMNVAIPAAPPVVMSVDLIHPSAPEPPKTKIEPPRPRPVEKRPMPQPVQENATLAVPAESPVAAPAAPVVEKPAVPPAPTFSPPVLPAPPAETVRPRFDADYLDNPKPAYPPLSRRMGEEGKVVLRVMVSAAGLPTAVELHTSSGSDRLDRAALEAVRRWKFIPARQGSEPVAASVLVPIVFSLKE